MDDSKIPEHVVASDTGSMEKTDSLEKAEGFDQADPMGDVAAHLYREVGQFSPEELQRERAIVRKRLDWILLPL